MHSPATRRSAASLPVCADAGGVGACGAFDVCVCVRRCPLCFESVYPQALKSLKFRLHSRVAVGDAVSMVLVQRDKGSLALTSAYAPQHLRDTAAKAMREGHRTAPASAFPASSSPPSPSSLLGVECALDVDPHLDDSLLSRLTWTSDITSICRRELEELSAASALHLSSSAPPVDDFHHQFILAAQEAVYRRLEQWSAAHPDSSQQVRGLLAHAHAAQRKAEVEAREKERSRREEAQRSAREAAQQQQLQLQLRKATSPSTMKGPTTSTPLPARPPPSSVSVNLDDATAWPALSSGGGGGRGGAAAQLPRPIRSLQPHPKPVQGSGPASIQPHSTATLTTADGTDPPIPSTSSSSASSSLPHSSSAFFDSGEEEEEEEAEEATAARATTSSALLRTSASQPLQLSASLLRSPPSPAPFPVPPPPPSFPSVDVSRCFYFYQSLDGQCLFLHSLCYRALLYDSGNDPARLPPLLIATVEAVEEGFMDASVASRYRFLSHLPTTTPFKLLSLSLAQLVQPATVAAFAAEWREEQRARQRRLQQHQRQVSKRVHRQRQQQSGGSGRWPSNLYAAASSSPPSPPSSASSFSLFAASAYAHAASLLGDEEGEVDAASVTELLDSFPALHSITAAPHSPHSPHSSFSAAAAETQSASTSSALPSSASAPSPPLPGWNAIAERGLAATSTWASLPGASSQPHQPPPAPQLPHRPSQQPQTQTPPSLPPQSPSASPLLSSSTQWGKAQHSHTPPPASAPTSAAASIHSSSSSSSTHRLKFRPMEGK